MTLAAQLEALLAKASSAPWTCEPRCIGEQVMIDEGKDPIEVAAESTEGFLGWYVLGPEAPGRGDFFGRDAALICLLRNNAGVFLDALKARANEWRPIETAPKDGTPVLLWRGGENIKRATIGWYKNLSHSWHDGSNEPAYPTHWQPLPTPPAP